MNQYVIEGVIDGIERTYDHASFGHMIVAFAQDVNTALANGKDVGDFDMYRSESRVQVLYGFRRILLVGAAISGLPIQAVSPDGTVLQFMNTDDLFSVNKRIDLKWENAKFVMTLIGVNVTLTPDWIKKSDLKTWLCNWEFLASGFKRVEKKHHESVQPEPVDTDWMLGYYVRNELKQIKALLETDLQEAKKRISVMEFMINKVKN